MADELRAMGHVVEVIGPDRFRTVPCPTYPDIRLSLLPGRRLARIDRALRAGPRCTSPPRARSAWRPGAGRSARGAAFTTSFHTRFPEYMQARTGLPLWLAYAFLRRFHGAPPPPWSPPDACATSWRRAASPGCALVARRRPGRFAPEPRRDWAAEHGVARPVFLYVGRIAVEKNIEAFLGLDLPGSKVVVGGGPQLAALKARYPGVVFTGPFSEAELAAAYAGGDVFVFPCRTDTFGLVLLEALACGVPVAAYDVTGPRDILAGADPRAGAVAGDLRDGGAGRPRRRPRGRRARTPSASAGRACAETFLAALAPVGAPTGRRDRRRRMTIASGRSALRSP